MWKTLWRKKFVIIALAFLVAFLPMAMTRDASVLSKTIVTAIGIDKSGGEVSVTIESLIFNFDPFGVPERELTSATAPTIDEALYEISLNMGRRISFSHTSLILLGAGLDDTDLTELLHPFLLKPQLNNGAVLMWTEDDVETVLQTSIDTGDVRSAKLQQLATFNAKPTTDRISTSLEEFFRNSLGRSGNARINIIELDGDELVNSDRTARFNRGKYQ